MEQRVHNRSSMLGRRRQLRRDATRSESALWERARRNGNDGYPCRRQHSIEAYVVDFYFPNVRLAVELDGPVHDSDEARQYDAQRTAAIEAHGVIVLRFRDEEVEKNIDSVCARIAAKLAEMRRPKADGS